MKSERLTRREIVNILNELEKKYPVESWKMDDIYIWPILKKDIFFAWAHATNTRDRFSSQEIINKSTWKKGCEVIVSIFYFFSLVLRRKRKASIIFAGATSHRVVYKGLFINRFFQPIIEHLNTSDLDSISIEYSEKDSSQRYPVGENIIFINKYLSFLKLIQFFNRGVKVENLEGFSSFVKEVKEQIVEVKSLDLHQQLSASIKAIKQYVFIYDILLEKYSPQLIVALCYYDKPVYGLNYSAYKLGIPTVDLQHGGQGELHVPYSNFSKVPKKGFNILPKVFWCWDETSEEVVKKWTKAQTFHDVKISGNPWLSYSESSKDYQFPAKKIILYTMQFDELEDFIIEAIKKTPEGYQWWLRLHPRKVSAKEEILRIIDQHKLQQKVEVEKATEYPLPEILKQSTVLITRYSGSAIEAIELGVKGIIIDEVGVSMYREYIDNGKAIALLNESSDELWNIIREIKPESRGSIRRDEEKYKDLILEACFVKQKEKIET